VRPRWWPRSGYIARGRLGQALLKAVRRWEGAAINLEMVLDPFDSEVAEVLNMAIRVSAVLSQTLWEWSPSAWDGALEISLIEDAGEAGLPSGCSSRHERIDIIRGCPRDSKTAMPKEWSICWCDSMWA
jgi:hypothetical protein